MEEEKEGISEEEKELSINYIIIEDKNIKKNMKLKIIIFLNIHLQYLK